MPSLNIIDWTNRVEEKNAEHRGRFLILHHTVIKTAEETLAVLNKRGLSVHYIVDRDGTIYQTVPPEKRAFHAGVSQWGSGDALRTHLNDTSLGIEIVNSGDEPFPEVQMQAVVNLSRMLMDKYAITAENILSHAEIAAGRKFDPSAYFDWEWYHARLDIFLGLYDTQLSSEEQKEVILSKQDKQEDKIRTLQDMLSKRGCKISITGVYDQDTMNAVEAFNRRFCPEIFYKEKMENGEVVRNSLNTQWYQLSEERLLFLIYPSLSW